MEEGRRILTRHTEMAVETVKTAYSFAILDGSCTKIGWDALLSDEECPK
jgi:hypothetical protein